MVCVTKAGRHVKAFCTAANGFLTVCMPNVCRLVARQPPPSAATPAELELMGRARGPGSNDAWQDESSDDDSDRVRPLHCCCGRQQLASCWG